MMQKTFFTWLSGLMTMAVILLLQSPALAISIGFEPVSQDVALGDSAQVALVISGLGDHQADSLGTFDFTVLYDSSILDFQGLSFGDPGHGDQLDISWGTLSGVTSSPGAVNLFEISYDSATTIDTNQLPAFTLATLSFDTIGLGTSALGIVPPSSQGGPYFGDANSYQLDVELEQGSISVHGPAPVPEPATMLLFCTGLTGLAVLRRKQRHGIDTRRRSGYLRTGMVAQHAKT